MRAKKSLWTVALVLACTCFVAGAWGRECTKAEARAAARASDRLSTWADAYWFFRRYSQCDDGAIAEHYLEVVSLLLAENWASLPDFARLAKREEPFKSFVFWHLGEAVPMERWNTIAANARSRCPREYHCLCVQLLSELEQLNHDLQSQ